MSYYRQLYDVKYDDKLLCLVEDLMATKSKITIKLNSI